MCVCVSLERAVKCSLQKTSQKPICSQLERHTHKHIVTLTRIDTYRHTLSHTRTLFTLPSGQTRQSGRGEAGINDTMISRPDLSVELREDEEEADEEEEGQL